MPRKITITIQDNEEKKITNVFANPSDDRATATDNENEFFDLVFGTIVKALNGLPHSGKAFSDNPEEAQRIAEAQVEQKRQFRRN